MCDRCDLMVINGVECHELGCPNTPRECKNCDAAAADGYFCSSECRNDYYGIVDPWEEEEEEEEEEEF